MKQERESTCDRHRMQPDGDKLDLVQAAGTGVLIGVRDQAVQVLEEKISSNQRPDKQDAKDNPDVRKKFHIAI